MNGEMVHGTSCEKSGTLISKLTAQSILVTTYSGPAILGVWDEVESAVKMAADWSRGEFLAEDALKALLARQMLLWVFEFDAGHKLVVITEIRDFPRKRVCNVYAAAGEDLANAWEHAMIHFGEWLRENHIDEVTATCRDSIARMLQSLGFTRKANVMTYSCKEVL